MSGFHRPLGSELKIVERDRDSIKVSRIERVHYPEEDYHKATTLSAWLFMKYDMTYKQFSRKSKNRKDELRHEYTVDTGRNVV